VSSRELVELGASAYLVKSSSSEHLISAVRAAVFDPTSRYVVVGMPLGMLEGTQEGVDSVLSDDPQAYEEARITSGITIDRGRVDEATVAAVLEELVR